MKTIIFRQVLLMGLLAWAALSQLGCVPKVNQRKNELVTHSATQGHPHSNDPMVLLHRSGIRGEFSFLLDGKEVGTDHNEVIRLLNQNGLREIVFVSEYKLSPESVAEFVERFKQMGISIREFWIPRSSSPGNVNVLDGR